MTRIIVTQLTNELNIRTIDAQNILNEAMLNLGMYGYPDDDDTKMQNAITQEAIRIFQQRPEEMKRIMKKLKSTLDDSNNKQHMNNKIMNKNNNNEKMSSRSSTTSESTTSTCPDLSSHSSCYGDDDISSARHFVKLMM